jgi:hypothetical protein
MSKLSITVIITLTVGFVAAAGLNVIQYQRAENTQKLLKGEITDLRYEINQRAGDADTESPTGASSTPTPVPQTAGSPTPTPAVAGTQVLSIPELGTKVSYGDPITDLTYYMTKSGVYQVAALITSKIKTDYPGCSGSTSNNVLGQIVRKTESTSTGKLIKKIGDYNYFYLKPSGYCTDAGTGRTAIDAARTYVENFVIPSLST